MISDPAICSQNCELQFFNRPTYRPTRPELSWQLVPERLRLLDSFYGDFCSELFNKKPPNDIACFATSQIH